MIANFSESVSYPRNWYGLRLEGSQSLIRGNNITNNDYGVIGYYAVNNLIFNNNFENNRAAQVYGFDYANSWNVSYPSGGNYWSNYQDVDAYHGPSQDMPGSDGIWDHPYIINVNNKDAYPLVKPYTPRNLTISIYTDKYTYYTGDTMRLGLNVTNFDGQMAVCFAIWVVLPNGLTHPYMHIHTITLPATFSYSNPAFQTITLPSITPGIYTWHAAFLNPSTHTIIVESTAQWQFS